jgi:hypothetical protein
MTRRVHRGQLTWSALATFCPTVLPGCPVSASRNRLSMCTCAGNEPCEFSCALTDDTPLCFEVQPCQGNLHPRSPTEDPSEGPCSICVTFTCKDFGRTARGVLHVWTSQGQFTYSVLGRQPEYHPPTGVAPRVSTRLDPHVTGATLLKGRTRNHVRKNIHLSAVSSQDRQI